MNARHGKVTLEWLPESLAEATSVHMEIAARVSYWQHLNHDYRQRFKRYKQYVLPELSFELSSIQRDNLERLVDLMRRSCLEKQVAPWRYKWGTGWPRTLVG